MKYNPDKFTYGCELEFADVDRFAKLPDGCTFDGKDHTIVNSNGIATDPKARTSTIGGEINTKATSTIDEQVSIISNVINSFEEVTINYRCNLHIHIRVPELKDDLESCKRLASYIRDNEKDVFKLVEPIPIPTLAEYNDGEAFAGAMKRYKRRLRSHQFRVYDSVYENMMKTKTVEEFYNAHGPWSDVKQRHLFHLCPRAAINLRTLWEPHHNTIEFRHFPGTLDLNEYASCLKWCKEFLNAALNTNESVLSIFNRNNEFVFPKFKPYNHEQEKTYLLTSYDYNNRTTIEANLKALQS